MTALCNYKEKQSKLKTFFTKTIILLATVFFITSCSNQDGVKDANAKFKAVTTFTIIADMAKNVAGDVAIVESITKAGAEIHNYQPTPGDIIKAQNADLILWNGLNLELWFEKFFENIKETPQAILTNGIKPVSISKGPYSGKPNPHAWMSPSNAFIYVDNIATAFAKHDPKNKDAYLKNAAAYKAQIEAVILPIKQQIESIPQDKRILVTSEGAFSYLARDTNMKEVFIWPINADQQGTPKQVRDVIEMVRTLNAGAVFSESTVPDAAAKQIARETGAAYGGILYVDSLTNPDGPVPTYLDLLKVTSQTIATGLSAAINDADMPSNKGSSNKGSTNNE